MSCSNGSCSCGSNCTCGSSCTCKAFADLSETTTFGQSMIVGFAPAKSFFDEGSEMGAENDGCNCGSSCTCTDCKCGK